MKTENNSSKVVGQLNSGIISTFCLTNMHAGQNIYCGDANKLHMQNSHPNDYQKYYSMLEDIIENPTYIAKHPKKESIEFIKEIQQNGETVLVAVRASGNGILFTRTLFVMSPTKIQAYKNRSALIPYKSIKK